VRLGTCILLELVVGASTLAALGVGSAYGVGELRAYLDHRDAPAAELAVATPEIASTTVLAPPPAPDELAIAAAPTRDSAAPTVAPDEPDADEAVAQVPTEPGIPAWHNAGDDAAALAPLLTGNVVKVKFNKGGTSLSLRLDFDNGARAAFKPDQTWPQSNPRREIAAYRIDRLLGLDRVPPAIGRTFSLDELIAAVPPSERYKLPRLREEAIARKGKLRGEMSWWIPVIRGAKVGAFPMDHTDGIVTWKKYLRPGAEIPPGDAALVRQISDMITFDFLLDNIDRWSGNNAQVSEDGSVLYFMDNTMALTSNPKGHRKSRTYLSRVATFSRRLIGRIRTLTADEVRAAVADDIEPFDQLLTDGEIDALIARRDKLLEYVDGLIAGFGEDKVLAFP